MSPSVTPHLIYSISRDLSSLVQPDWLESKLWESPDSPHAPALGLQAHATPGLVWVLGAQTLMLTSASSQPLGPHWEETSI